MKLSWVVVTGPKQERNEAIERLEIMADTYLSVSTPIQHALPDWFSHLPEIQKEIRARVRGNYMFLWEKIAKEKSLALQPFEGGWSAVIKFPESKTDEAWALELLNQEKILTFPGYLFDFQEGPYLVLSLLTHPTTFEEGVLRLISHKS